MDNRTHPFLGAEIGVGTGHQEPTALSIQIQEGRATCTACRIHPPNREPGGSVGGATFTAHPHELTFLINGSGQTACLSCAPKLLFVPLYTQRGKRVSPVALGQT